MKNSLLDGILSPKDVKKLPKEQIPSLIDEVRQRIVDVTLKNGGHMASSLGTVELIVALLRTFDVDKDRIIFDVGHQAYAWKLLTGRNSAFDSLRTEGGVSGFPKMYESVYDHFGVGHSSTSLSAALGYAVARDLKGETHNVVSVIGDGALINGVAFEALNQAGSYENPIIFILNDNAMSIEPRVGGMAMHLARLSASPIYKNTKNIVKAFCRRFLRGGRTYKLLKHGKNAAKKLISHGNLFVDMGLTYWGPFDGHNENELEKVFSLAKNYGAPLLIHLVTKKGKGYKPAEEAPVAFHSVSPAASGAGGISWSRAAAECIEKMAEQDPSVVTLTPAMAEGSSLSDFRNKFPERFFDVGIAEEHMLTFAAGLAAGGMRPVACVYSTFLQRAMDQLVHDICLQNLPVILAVDRAGLVGEDGETHQGLFDLNWGKVVPNLQIWSPFDRTSLENAFKQAKSMSSPVMVRYPKGKVADDILPDTGVRRLQYSGILRGGENCLMSFGAACGIALSARKILSERKAALPDLVCLNRVSPLPDDIIEMLKRYKTIFVVEENYLRGGLFDELSSLAVLHGLKCKMYSYAISEEFVAQGSVEQQRKRYSITPERIAKEYECESSKETSGPQAM